MVQFFWKKSQSDSGLKKPEDSEITLTPDEILALKRFAGFLNGGVDFPGKDRFVEFFRTETAERDAPRRKSLSTDDTNIIDSDSAVGDDKTKLTDETFIHSDKMAITDSRSEEETLTDYRISPGVQLLTYTQSFDSRDTGPVIHHSNLEQAPTAPLESAYFRGATIGPGVTINHRSFNGNTNSFIASGLDVHNRVFNGQRGFYWQV